MDSLTLIHLYGRRVALSIGKAALLFLGYFLLIQSFD